MQAQALEKLASRHGIELLLRFGSTAGGVPHAASDVDLAVLLRDREPSLDRLVALEVDLQPLFAEGRVDLAFLDRADPLFLKKILEHCELLVGKPRRLAELRMLAFRRYVDHRRFLAMESDYLKRRLARTRTP